MQYTRQAARNAVRIATLSALVLAVVISPLEAEDDGIVTAASLLPGTTALYVELPDPADLVNDLLQHPLRKRVESIPAVNEALQDQPAVQLRSAISIVEAGLGMRLNTALKRVATLGAVIAIDPATDGVALLLKSDDQTSATEIRDNLLAIAKQTGGENAVTIEQGEYRDIVAHAVGDQLRVAAYQQWTLATNKSDLGKKLLDAILDGNQDSLADNNRFQQAVAARPNQFSAWLFADVKRIRDSGAAQQLYSGKTDNILAEALLGGMMSNLQHTPYGTAEVTLSEEQMQVTLSTPHKHQWSGEARAYFFGPTGVEPAPALLQAGDRIFAASAYRDLSQMWLFAGDLLTEKAADELAQADSQLTTFFSGNDFGEDILGALEPETQLIVCRQNFDGARPIPALKLPSFALQFRMRTPVETRPQLRRVFQSLVGFLNVVGAMDGQPQLDLVNEVTDEVQLYAAQYVAPRPPPIGGIPLQYNFRPTIAFAGDRLIISSTTALAKELIQTTTQTSTQDGNTTAVLESAAAHLALSDNMEQLVAQNMLENGHSRSDAENETELLLEAINLLQQASLALVPSGSDLQLQFQLDFAP